MLKIHICEDDFIQRENLKELTEKIIKMEQFPMKLGYVEENPYCLLDKMKEEKENGVFFLDIDLKQKMNGLELAKIIREYQPRCYIIFVTTHSEMSYMTFTYKVEAMDFIIKDNPEDIQNRIFQCLLHVQELEEQYHGISKYDTFSIKIGSRIQQIPLDDILFFQVVAHKIMLHTRGGLYEFSGILRDIENSLDSRFHRCHRSYIVNKDNIDQIDEEQKLLRMKGGEECPMSTRLGKGVKK